MVDMEEKITELNVSEEAVAETTAEVTEDVVVEMTEEEAAEVSENLEKLEQKGTIYKNAAEKHKHLRDELNKQTKEWVSKRDALNAQVRELVEQAGKHREERDALNQKVRESKVVRDELNKNVSRITEEYRELKGKNAPQIAPETGNPRDRQQAPPSIKQLKKEFSDLEMRQQTQVLKKEEELRIVKRLKEIESQIEGLQKDEETSDEAREKLRELKEAKSEAEAAHKVVSEYAEKAQQEHDIMISLYEQADALRKQADDAQANFIDCKKRADEEHKLHLEQVNSFRQTDEQASTYRKKKSDARKRKTDADSKKAADDIFARFKNGEKLSTEDLMALQKSGYL